MLSIVNLGLSIKSLTDAEPGIDSDLAVISVVGSGAQVVASAGVLLEISDLTVGRLGMVAAIINVGTGIPDAIKAIGTNDYSTLVGTGLTAAGNVLMGLECYCGTLGASLSVTILGLPLGAALEYAGAVVAAVGLIVTLLGEDSDVELFASHCYFGKHYGQGSGSKPWSQGKFEDWMDNFERICPGCFSG